MVLGDNFWFSVCLKEVADDPVGTQFSRCYSTFDHRWTKRLTENCNNICSMGK